MANSNGGRKRIRGEIEEFPSGSLRVRVYAGIDPVSKRRHYLTEAIPAGPKAHKLAEQAKVPLLQGKLTVSSQSGSLVEGALRWCSLRRGRRICGLLGLRG